MAFDVGSVVAKITADISGFQKGLGEAEKSASIFGDRITKVADVAGKAFMVAGAAIAGAMVLAGKTGMEAAMQFEQQEIAFTTLLKDREKAIAAIKAIEKDAKETPYNLPDLIKANQLLVSAGVNTEDARTQVKNLGNAIAATGGGTAELNRLAVNLQQIKAVGKAAAIDVKQFAFAGINIYQLLADATGKNVDEVKEMEITYDLLTEALAKASGQGGMFEGAMLNQSTSLQGLKSNLEDVVNITLKDVAIQSGLFDAMKNVAAEAVKFVETAGPLLIDAIQGLGDTITEVTGFLTEHKTEIQNVAMMLTYFFLPAIVAVTAKMAINFVMAIVNSTLNVIKFGIEGWKAIAMLIAKSVQLGIATAAFIFHTAVTIAQTVAQIALTAATWLFNAAMAVLSAPIWLVVAAIIALIAIGVLLWKNWDKVKEVAGALWETIKAGWNLMVEKLRETGQKILEALQWPFTKAKEKIGEVVDWIKSKLDFTQRHSPSVLDIVERGVGKVNKAFDDLQWTGGMTANMAAAAVTNNALGPGINNVVVNLDGAVIGDLNAADQIAERIGDSIVRRLQANVRF
ncbi:MAG: tape measure protein [Bacteroidales bacterium]|jgi:tape measure domain-containing protein